MSRSRTLRVIDWNSRTHTYLFRFPLPFLNDLPDEKRPTDSVTEGRGAYNKHAKLPAGGAALAMPHLENAVANLSLDASHADDCRSQVGLTGAIGANAERPRDN
jgi:hypothetical protein